MIPQVLFPLLEVFLLLLDPLLLLPYIRLVLAQSFLCFAQLGFLARIVVVQLTVHFCLPCLYEILHVFVFARVTGRKLRQID